MKKLKVLTVLGTRPEIIRLSRVIEKLDKLTTHKIVHTGQNYDYELNEVFFKEMKIRKPDYFLGVDPTSLGSVLGNVIIESEKVFQKESPDAVLILGDTNSSIAGIIAKRLKIPIYHMEAGNRSFDLNVPEEVNRKIIDHIADFNLVYTEHARRHLLSEGLHHRHIYLTGSPMKEVLNFYSEEINESSVLKKEKLNQSDYVLVSIHREENVDIARNLKSLINCLVQVSEFFDKDVIVSTHPRTRKRIDQIGGFNHPRITFSKPFGFFDYNKLQKESFCVISDSGTITEESSLLQFPAITIRQSMERPEGLDTGSIMITGFDSNIVVQSIEVVTQQFRANQIPPIPKDYDIDNVSDRVVKLIIGTAKLCHRWSGVRIDNDRE